MRSLFLLSAVLLLTHICLAQNNVQILSQDWIYSYDQSVSGGGIRDTESRWDDASGSDSVVLGPHEWDFSGEFDSYSGEGAGSLSYSTISTDRLDSDFFVNGRDGAMLRSVFRQSWEHKQNGTGESGFDFRTDLDGAIRFIVSDLSNAVLRIEWLADQFSTDETSWFEAQAWVVISSDRFQTSWEFDLPISGDGGKFGQAAFTRPLELPAGEYRLELSFEIAFDGDVSEGDAGGA